MMFLSLARNNSCVPLSCGFGLGFIPSPQNKIARFRHSTCRNLATSLHKNQQQSHVKMRFYSIFNGGIFVIGRRFQPKTLGGIMLSAGMWRELGQWSKPGLQLDVTAALLP